MKINDILNEAETNDYQKMMSFVRNSNIQGLPQDQQIALALFRELERQKAHNDQLDAELDAAEQRIDVATKGGELAKKELGKHQSELEKEHGNITKQQAALRKLDQTYSERDQASKEQLHDLTDKLEAIKSTPGLDLAVADKLEKEIDTLKKNGIGADKVAELEAAIADVQHSGHVDTETMKELVAKVNAAQATAQDLEQSRATLDQSTTQVQDQLEQIKQQLARFNNVEKTVTALKADVDQLENDYGLTDRAVLDMENEVAELKSKIADKTPTQQPAPQQQTPQPQQTPQQIAQAQALAKTDPRLVKSLMDKGVFKESQFERSIAWATGKTK